MISWKCDKTLNFAFVLISIVQFTYEIQFKKKKKEKEFIKSENRKNLIPC